MLLTTEILHKKVKAIVRETGLNHMDSLLKFCEDNMIDPEDIGHIVSPSLRSEIRNDAINNGLMKRGAELPI